MARKYRINIEGEERVVEVTEQSSTDYLISLDGKTYQTHIEDTRDSGGEVSISPAAVPGAARRASEAKAPLGKPPAAEERGSIQILSPLTGTVTNVKVVSGAIVERGQVLCLLEAMKMEIEVPATQSGVVVTVAVKPTDTVQQGDLLFVLHAD